MNNHVAYFKQLITGQNIHQGYPLKHQGRIDQRDVRIHSCLRLRSFRTNFRNCFTPLFKTRHYAHAVWEFYFINWHVSTSLRAGHVCTCTKRKSIVHTMMPKGHNAYIITQCNGRGMGTSEFELVSVTHIYFVVNNSAKMCHLYKGWFTRTETHTHKRNQFIWHLRLCLLNIFGTRPTALKTVTVYM